MLSHFKFLVGFLTFQSPGAEIKNDQKVAKKVCIIASFPLNKFIYLYFMNDVNAIFSSSVTLHIS